MLHKIFASAFFLFVSVMVISDLNIVSAQDSQWKFLWRVFDRCNEDTNVLKCIKFQALKIANRAMKLKRIDLYEGISLVQETQKGRVLQFYTLPESLNLQNLSEDQVDAMLKHVAQELISTRYLEFRQPRKLEEARRRKKKINFGPLLAAMAIKSAFMAMSYKGIAVTAGAAMLIGKMALVLCIIMGLKSLVSGKEEKLNVEVVKHPVHSTSHTYSSSYEDDHYHRSISAEEEMLRRGKEKWGGNE